MKEKLISICVITFQHEKYIIDCINSIINQTYKTIELLIVDDASSDNTVKIIKNLEETLERRFVRFHLVEHERNTGCVSQNLNELIKISQGEYVKCLSGDDFLDKEYVCKSEKFLDTHQEYILSYTNGFIINDNFRMGEKKCLEPIYNFHKPTYGVKKFEVILKSNYLPAPTVLIRREAFEKYGLYDEECKIEDLEFWLRLARKEEFGFLNSKLVYWRRSKNSLSNYRTRDGEKKLLFMMKEVYFIIKRYLVYISKEQRIKYLYDFYNGFLITALDCKFYPLALKIKRNMKKIDEYQNKKKWR